MVKALRAIGYTATAGLGFATSTEVGVRVGWRAKPRPMPHQFARFLDHSWRLKYRDPGDTLGLFGFEAGMSVVDAGCGSGLFTEEMARMVGPQGLVHAVDIQYPCLVRASQRLIAAEMSDRVRLHHSGLYELPIADESIDLAVLIATLGEIPEPLLALVELKRVLKPGARIAVSEEIPDPAYLPAGQVQELLQEAGFRFGGKSGWSFLL